MTGWKRSRCPESHARNPSEAIPRSAAFLRRLWLPAAALLAVAGVMLLQAFPSPPAQAQGADLDPIFDGTISVEVSSLTGRLAGYIDTSPTALGALSPGDSFTANGNSYEIRAIYLDVVEDDLIFIVSRRLPSSSVIPLVLRLGDTYFTVNEADESACYSFCTNYYYLWNDPGISWDDGDEVKAVLDDSYWKTALTAGRSETDDRTVVGFTESLGSLSPATFPWKDEEFTVNGIYTVTENDATKMYFEISSGDLDTDAEMYKAALQIQSYAFDHLDVDRRYAIYNAGIKHVKTNDGGEYTGEIVYQWGSSELGWAAGSVHVVKLQDIIHSTVQTGHYRPNTPATGVPTINGTPGVGETLTVDTSGISDEDGMDDATFTFYWFADYDTGTRRGLDRSTTTDTTYRVQPRDAGLTLTVRARFNDNFGNTETSASAATVAVAATEPDAPQNLNVSLHGTGALHLSWEAPSWDLDTWFDESENLGDGGSSITGYNVQWKESAGSWNTPADVSEATVAAATHTITRLTNGLEYTVRVLATNDVGNGSWSAVVTGTPATTPGAPAIGSVTLGDETLTVAWSAPSDDGGAGVTGYDLRYIRSDATDKADANWTVNDSVWSSGELLYNLIGLTNGVGYDLQARAVNSAGEGDWSSTHNGTPGGAPDAPHPGPGDSRR